MTASFFGAFPGLLDTTGVTPALLIRKPFPDRIRTHVTPAFAELHWKGPARNQALKDLVGEMKTELLLRAKPPKTALRSALRNLTPRET
jgi:hypothetical protein